MVNNDLVTHRIIEIMHGEPPKNRELAKKYKYEPSIDKYWRKCDIIKEMGKRFPGCSNRNTISYHVDKLCECGEIQTYNAINGLPRSNNRGDELFTVQLNLQNSDRISEYCEKEIKKAIYKNAVAVTYLKDGVNVDKNSVESTPEKYAEENPDSCERVERFYPGEICKNRFRHFVFGFDETDGEYIAIDLTRILTIEPIKTKDKDTSRKIFGKLKEITDSEKWQAAKEQLKFRTKEYRQERIKFTMSRKHLSDFNAEFGMNINIENKNNKPTAEITFYADKKDFFKWVLQSEADISALNTEKELSEWLKELSSHYCSTD